MTNRKLFLNQMLDIGGIASINNFYSPDANTYKGSILQADKYFNTFFEYFDIIAQRPFSFESVDYIKPGYKRCVCGSDSIYFKVSKNIVEIMAIVGRQDL